MAMDPSNEGNNLLETNVTKQQRGPIPKLAKSLRRDILAKVKPLTERAELLAMIDPTFRNELEQLGLMRIVNNIRGSRAVEAVARGQQIHSSVQNIRRASGGPPPLEHLRRKLREDLNLLLEEVQLLRYIDTRVDQELEHLGFAPFLDQRYSK